VLSFGSSGGHHHQIGKPSREQGARDSGLTRSAGSINQESKVQESAMPPQRWIWRLSMALYAGVVLGTAPVVAEESPDWPCDLPLTQQFVPAEVWGAALPDLPQADWRADPAVRAVVEFAANPENPPREGAKRIAAFAAPLGAGREQRLLLVFTGLLDQFSLLSGFIVEGVRDFVLRARILRDAIAQNDVALAALPAAGGADVEEQRRGYLEARAWDARSMDDAMEEAEFLCHRYAYLGEKLRRLTAAVRSAL
jgi:hypothetical protein